MNKQIFREQIQNLGLDKYQEKQITMKNSLYEEYDFYYIIKEISGEFYLEFYIEKYNSYEADFMDLDIRIKVKSIKQIQRLIKTYKTFIKRMGGE